MNRLKLLFLFVAELMGVRLFKKYWIVSGSYWNRSHINPNNANDLYNVIFYTYLHTFNHVVIILAEIYVAIFKTNWYPWYYLAASGAFHSYAFMLQLYNYLKAKRSLAKLD